MRQTAAQCALSYLPPDIISVLEQFDIEPVDVEASGALRLRISNSISLADKSIAIKSFRDVLQEYGLGLWRSVVGVSSQSAWDDSLLMIKRNDQGLFMPLFDLKGVPYAEEAPRRAARNIHS